MHAIETTRRKRAGVCITALRWGLALVLLVAALLSGVTAQSAEPAGATEAPGLDELIARLDERIARLEDIMLRVEMRRRLANGDAPVEAMAELVVRPPGLLRFTYQAPDAYAGVIITVDRGQDRVQWYHPVTHQVFLMSIEKFLGDYGLPVDPDELFSLPPRDQYDLTVEGTVIDDGVRYTVVQARGKDDPATAYTFWIDLDQMLITRMHLLDAQGRVANEIHIEVLDMNQGISAQQITRMPAGAEQIVR